MTELTPRAEHQEEFSAVTEDCWGPASIALERSGLCFMQGL
jgi:hypothetical protein